MFKAVWIRRGINLAVAVLVVALHAETISSQPPMRVAITFDDLPGSLVSRGVADLTPQNMSILAALQERGITSTGFVNEVKLYATGEVDARVALLQAWLDAGQELGNHTFSHPSLHDIPVEAYLEDIARGETVTAMLLDARGESLRWFRHPYLRTGRSLEVHERVEEFLNRRGYTIAPVTLENTDWMFNSIYVNAIANHDDALGEQIVSAYLEFTASMLDFFEGAARSVLGYDPPHVLLLHVNALNAVTLPAILDMLDARGYAYIRLEEALADAVYARPDRYTGPAGVNWVFRWDDAETRQVDWRQEPSPPEFVRVAYQNR